MYPLRVALVHLALVLAVNGLEATSEIIGYWVGDGTTVTASCTGSDPLYFTSGSRGGCLAVTSSRYTVKESGYSCTSNWELFIEETVITESRTPSTGYAIRSSCKDDGCVTLTVFQASPKVTPSVELITCAESLGLPASARTLYRVMPTGGTGPDGGSNQGSGNNGGNGDGDGGGGDGGGGETSKPNPRVIAGAVVGSLGGIALLVGVGLLVRRRGSKKTWPWKPENLQPQTYAPDNRPPELTADKPAASAAPAAPVSGPGTPWWAQSQPAVNSTELPAEQRMTAAGTPATNELEGQRITPSDFGTGTVSSGTNPSELTSHGAAPGELPSHQAWGYPSYEMPAQAPATELAGPYYPPASELPSSGPVAGPGTPSGEAPRRKPVGS